jgi:ABC-type branched-subunit amino acid transport system substrate-binding protein
MDSYFRAASEAINKSLAGLFIIFALAGCSYFSPAKEEQPVRQLKTGKPVAAPEALAAPVMPEKTVRIGLLLPLSGTNQKLGESMLDAAQLAIIDIGKKNLVLVPIDSGKDPVSAQNAMTQAVEKKVDIVLGPLFGNGTMAAAPIAKQAGINVISFSNDKSLARDNVFLLGFMPDEQVRRVVKYAAGKGLKRFSGFAPDSEYGKLMMEEFRRTAIMQNVSIGFADFYKSSNEARVDVSKAALITPENTQVAFIPEGDGRLTEIAAIIAKNTADKGKIQLIGSGQWDDPSILTATQLEGGWFAGTPPKLHADFEAHFSQVYHYQPSRVASLAYDGVALVAHLANSASGPDFSKESITNARGFAGVNGIFRFRKDGISERGLSILQVKSTGFEEIDPAPENFSGF